MKKKILLLSALTLLSCVSCGSEEESSLSREVISSSEATTSSEAVSSESTSADTSLEPGDYLHNLKEEDYKTFYTYYFAKLNQYRTFKTVTEGKTKASIVTQPIHSEVIKSEYSYMSNESHSSFADTEHYAYYHGGKVVHKDYGEEEWTVSSQEDYLNKYGFYPFDQLIEGYIVKNETLLEVSISPKEDYYEVIIKLDPNTSTTNVKIQMKEFGGLGSYPEFQEVKLTLNLKDDYTPITIVADTTYKVKKGILNPKCSQEYTVTFSNFDEEIEVPNLDEIKPLFK